MKKIILLLLLVIFGFTAKSQVIVNDVNINDLDIQYIELIGAAKILNPFKIKVYVDYGQKMSWKQQTIKNAEGKNYAFNTMVEALNFLSENGWEYVNNYVVNSSDGSLTYRYLLKRKS